MAKWVVTGTRTCEVEAATSDEALLAAIDEFHAMSDGFDHVEVEKKYEPLLPPDLPIARR